MKEKALSVEFRLPATKTPPSPKPPPGAKAKRRRRERAARKARNLALAYWIDGLIRSGEVADLAAVARMCGVSRARVSRVAGVLGTTQTDQERLLRIPWPASRPARCTPLAQYRALRHGGLNTSQGRGASEGAFSSLPYPAEATVATTTTSRNIETPT